MALNDDTLEWLEKRNEYRNKLAAAFNGGGDGDPAAADPDADPAPAAAPAAPPAADAEACADGGGCPAENDRFVDTDNDMEQEGGGFPQSDNVYAEIADKLANKEGDNKMEVIIGLQREANTLESYRKMQLHKNWQRCHHLAAFASCLSKEDQLQSEIEQLLQNQQVGREGNAAEDEG